MQPEGGLSVQEREAGAVQAAEWALEALVISYRLPDDAGAAFVEVSLISGHQYHLARARTTKEAMLYSASEEIDMH